MNSEVDEYDWSMLDRLTVTPEKSLPVTQPQAAHKVVKTAMGCLFVMVQLLQTEDQGALAVHGSGEGVYVWMSGVQEKWNSPINPPFPSCPALPTCSVVSNGSWPRGAEGKARRRKGESKDALQRPKTASFWKKD